ncbi:MAG TPA: GxxExxY protein [Tepidisphaeraceae bacterium]|jgi:GxxExxY protein|nr:GxxExxY protein [Tepidisphaeraceae bacterium]
MDTDVERLNRITEIIIGCAFKVHNVLGTGFSGRVYENALAHDLRKAGLHVESQVAITVWYDGIVVGEHIADLIIEHEILVENKAVRAMDDGFTAQCINYLACTTLPLCLLLNFGRKVEIKRFRGPGKKAAI